MAQTINLFGQNHRISDKLVITQLTDKTYIHTCNNGNGIIFISNNQALIISTPDSDIETQNLIDWVTNEKKSQIVAYVADRWHPDAMEGLDVVQQNGIKTYACELTRQIAKTKGLPVAEFGFYPKIEIQVGTEKVVCNYLGEAHTKDGIVAWIPCEQILFGGNEIRNFNGWIGNIGDACLGKWSETAEKIRNEYGSAQIVVPGHGEYGGPELIDYTIKLYETCKTETGVNNKNIPLQTIKDVFYVKAESDITNGEKRILKNAVVVVRDSAKYVKIESPEIVSRPDMSRLSSELGRLKIYDKNQDSVTLRIDVNFKNLNIYKLDDYVGLVVILREITDNNQ